MSEQFDFDLDAPVNRITNEQIIDSLKAYYAENKSKVFSKSEYDGWSRRICSSDTIQRRFGSWRKALKSIGIEKGVTARNYTAEELMDNLEYVWRQLGYPPGQRKIGKYGYGFSETPYRKRWGSLRTACRLLAQFKNGQISEDQLFGKTINAKQRRAIPLNVRWNVLKRDNYQCVKCGNRPPAFSLQVDHIVPVSRGGGNSFENLQTLCNVCNMGKKDQFE